MKNRKTKITIFAGIICALLTGAASWYTIVFNESRFILPMNLSAYSFRTQDLPMIISGILLMMYILYLAALFLKIVKPFRGETSIKKWVKSNIEVSNI